MSNLLQQQSSTVASLTTFFPLDGLGLSTLAFDADIATSQELSLGPGYHHVLSSLVSFGSAVGNVRIRGGRYGAMLHEH